MAPKLSSSRSEDSDEWVPGDQKRDPDTGQPVWDVRCNVITPGSDKVEEIKVQVLAPSKPDLPLMGPVVLDDLRVSFGRNRSGSWWSLTASDVRSAEGVR